MVIPYNRIGGSSENKKQTLEGKPEVGQGLSGGTEESLGNTTNGLQANWIPATNIWTYFKSVNYRKNSHLFVNVHEGGNRIYSLFFPLIFWVL
jgi:hypothetical protein